MIITKNKKTIILILIAFIFSFSVRLIWLYQFNDLEQYKFNGQFMINSNDGYLFAKGARDILSDMVEVNESPAAKRSLSILTAVIFKILPFEFETIILYMSVFFSSLLVIPLILIGKKLGKLEMGFIAALVGSIAWSYYNRTMIGYYDTDLLNIVFPTFLLWSIVWAIDTKEDKYLLFTALDMIAYRWWYTKSYSLEFAFFGMVTLYVIYLYIKKHDYKYNLTLVVFMLLSIMEYEVWLRFVIVISLFILFKLKKDLIYKYIYYLFGLTVLLFIVGGGVEPIISLLKSYVFKSNMLVAKNDLTLHFYSVMQTIKEAGKISFETFSNRISGHTITFILSLVGYIWLVFKHRIMLLGLPLLGLGFLGYTSGLRFTIYAVPICALGISFFIVELSNLFKNNITKYSLMIVLTICVLFPNIKHIINYRVSTILTKNEVLVLDKLKKIADREDYVVAWWDYGYPIRYYADVKTLSDGAKHSGSVNFPISFLLTNPQNEASKMLRLAIEYKSVENMTLNYGYKDTNQFLKALQSDIKLPQKTSDIYLYLPYRMMEIFPTIKLFSNIDLMTGEKFKNPFFYKSNQIKEDKEKIYIGNNINIIKKRGALQVGDKTFPINRFIKTVYNKKGRLVVKKQIINKKSGVNVIYMSNYKTFVVVSNSVYNSTFFQLFVLENYNKNLYEPVIFNSLAKVYKLKI